MKLLNRCICFPSLFLVLSSCCALDSEKVIEQMKLLESKKVFTAKDVTNMFPGATAYKSGHIIAFDNWKIDECYSMTLLTVDQPSPGSAWNRPSSGVTLEIASSKDVLSNSLPSIEFGQIDPKTKYFGVLDISKKHTTIYPADVSEQDGARQPATAENSKSE